MTPPKGTTTPRRRKASMRRSRCSKRRSVKRHVRRIRTKFGISGDKKVRETNEILRQGYFLND